ncbi:MAG: DPP IV N-terminal domain-containing protein [Gammaproteobacteria bacterium]|nr:DPP IV N-terminal domain-containing protein [Gammaproteobacteria bacterium]
MFLIFLIAIFPLSPGAEPLSAMDVFDLEWASDPRVAPDGQRIVYVRRSNDIMQDRTRSNLWEVSIDGTSHRPLYSGVDNYSNPRFSPDGERLAFTSNESGNRQIYVRWMDTGQTALVAGLQESPRSLTWSPDGKWLAFTLPVKADAKPIAKPRKPPEGAKWADKPIIVQSTRYQYDGRGIIEPAYRHVFVVPADGGSPRQLTSGDYNHYGALAWSADSDLVYFSANRTADWELVTDEADIYAVNIASKNLERITDMPGAERSPKISPDSRYIAFSREERRALAYTPKEIGVMDTSGGNHRLLTTNLDADADGAIWAEDSKSLYFTYDERAVRKIARVTLDGRITDVASGLGGTMIGRPYLSGTIMRQAGLRRSPGAMRTAPPTSL